MYNRRKRPVLQLMKKATAYCVFALLALASVAMPAAAQVGTIGQEAQPATTADVAKPEGHKVFGSWIFDGQFARQQFTGFNPDYHLAVGDNVTIQLWGGFEYRESMVVDNQGNIFLPKVGPVHLLGVRNGDLNEEVTKAVQRVFKTNVGVYASLDGAEPVKVFVTGFVKRPGLYAGHSSDSIVRFLDMAGGIDSLRGSYISVEVLRQGKLLKTVNLYDFLLYGKLPAIQLYDGDTVLVKGVRSQIGVRGLVQNAFTFEFDKQSVTVKDVLGLARPESRATHVRIHRNNLAKEEVEYYPLSEAGNVKVSAGDVLEVTSDKIPGTISVRVEGEHLGRQEYVLPYGARLSDVLKKIKFTKDALPGAIQLFRASVQKRQKEMLMAQLTALESSVLTARSNTTDEAVLREHEAGLVLKWVERAKNIEPKGQVTLAGSPEVAKNLLLESGDIIRIPRKSNLIMVHGDVLFPSAMTFEANRTPEDYINLAGGFVQQSSSSNVLVLHRDGTFDKLSQYRLDSHKTRILPGDEIFVLPRVQTKYFQLAKDITQVLYQIAVSAGVILRL
ncbi:polysaccharide biosynthesis/export family protein [Kordiimonas marina]|uniref:polysaccharide biosynthesis/export family protein n=1 Tax=Kordiimonas marina TaxID=2872312 RepID=UPI001FF49468|nr:polysaccharide biosynthesis/export family protein [Kordiimonas marina]MCJ9428724.1 polysaccharide export protein [Kordiimonas marina]